jgi:ParB family protein of integrating conjugative element (PFGI_1 class)
MKPVPDKQRVLDVNEIALYDHNPRHSANPKFDVIKASIRAQGMDQPLVVTRRPGETAYMIGAGGNTRLKILQALYEETGEARFRDVSCIYRPWTGETDVLVAHLRENDLRGDLTFLDKALAVKALKHLIQEEQGEDSVTQTQLAEALSDRGYALSQGLISQMAYTVERLLPLLPAALKGGMGRPQVERIRQLERAARALWLDRSVDTEDEFDQAFAELCRRYDSPEWDIGNLRRALEAEIAERAEVSIHAVSMVLEGYLAGRRDLDAGADWLTETDDDGMSDAEPVAATNTPESVSPPPKTGKADDATARDGDTPGPRDAAEASAPSAPDGDAEIACEDNADTLQSDAPASETTAQLESMDLKSLRARAWTLASRLAQRNGLSELIQPLAGKGLGFVLCDVPDPALVDQLDEDTLAQVSMVWWYLAAASEVTVAPVEQLLPSLDNASVLRRALEDQDAGLLFSSVWTLDPGHMGFRLWRRLDARDWRDLVDLMETYRAVHQAAADSGHPLWP